LEAGAGVPRRAGGKSLCISNEVSAFPLEFASQAGLVGCKRHKKQVDGDKTAFTP
jgi:hypothetical protein